MNIECVFVIYNGYKRNVKKRKKRNKLKKNRAVMGIADRSENNYETALVKHFLKFHKL